MRATADPQILVDDRMPGVHHLLIDALGFAVERDHDQPAPVFPALVLEGPNGESFGAISEAVAARLSRFEDIPRPGKGDLCVILPLQLAMKVDLFWQLQKAGKTRADLVRDLKWHRPQVDRLFDPNHATKLDRYEVAFAALGTLPDIVLRDLDAIACNG